MRKKDSKGNFIQNDPMESFMEKVSKSENGCWNWTQSSGRYGNFSSKSMGFVNGISAHRASWILFRNENPGDMQVLHKCDNTKCVNPDHLFLGTQKDNIQDCMAKGRRPTHLPPTRIGVENNKAILNEEKVRGIRELRTAKLTFKEIGLWMNISAKLAHDVVSGKTWKHIQ